MLKKTTARAIDNTAVALSYTLSPRALGVDILINTDYKAYISFCFTDNCNYGDGVGGGGSGVGFG